MATLEALSLGGLNLNDQTTWYAESLTIAPPSKRLQRLSSPDADADLLAEVATYELRQVTLRLRYVASGGTVDTALTAINALQGYLQQAEELDSGSALTWTPANSTFTGTMYVQTGEITDLPVTWDGDDAGWFFANPVITVRLDCFPFIHGTEYSAGTMSSTSNRIGTLTAASVPGTVPGLGRLVVTDAATQNRSHVEIGGERYGYNSGSPSSLDILGSSMTALGGTITGSGAGSYVSMSVGTTPVALAEVTGMGHIGPHNIRAQVERTATGTTLKVRAASRTNDGPWTYTPWRTVPSGIGTYDIFCGSLDFPVVKKGTQSSTLRFECYASAASTIKLYRLNPIPTEVVYGLARAIAPASIPSATSYIYVDAFNQAGGGSLSGKSPDTGAGTWSESGAATNFTYDSTAKNVSRAVNDSLVPHFATIGSTSSAAGVQAYVQTSLPTFGIIKRGGVVTRYSSTSNYAAAYIDVTTTAQILTVVVCSGGTVTTLFSQVIGALTATIQLVVVGGVWQVSAGGFSASGYDATLAALAAGTSGLYNSANAALAFYYDSFYTWTPTSDVALYSGRSMEFRWDSTIREVSGGSAWTNVPSFRGRRLYIPPAGPGGLTTRLAIKDRRSDVDGGQADSADSARTATLYVTPRYLSVPGT